MEELLIYKEIIKAIKSSVSNIELETDMNNININKKDFEYKLIKDIEIQEKAKEKVLKYNDYKRK